MGTQWSWKPEDEIKSLKRCIDVLVTCAGRNGNLALNTNPMPDGQIEPRQAERFREIGHWLKQYGESIYGTRGGPFLGLDCLSTRKDNRVYVHVLKWHTERLQLPGIPRKIVSSKLLTGGTATVRQTEEQIEIDVPAEQRQELDTIILLELDGPASELKPVPVPVASLTFGKKVTASSVYPEPVGANYRPEYAVDGDPDSGWTFAKDLKSAWLEVDLGQAVYVQQSRDPRAVRSGPRVSDPGQARRPVGDRSSGDADRGRFFHDVSAGDSPVRPPRSPRHHD